MILILLYNFNLKNIQCKLFVYRAEEKEFDCNIYKIIDSCQEIHGFVDIHNNVIYDETLNTETLNNKTRIRNNKPFKILIKLDFFN